MKRHARFLYQPVMPLGNKRNFVTGCIAHQKLSKEASIEGTVLLKNNGALPLGRDAKICLFGRGAGDFLFGGGGSGRVYTNTKVSLADSLKSIASQGNAEFFEPLVSFYSEEIRQEYEKMDQLPKAEKAYWATGHDRPLPVLPEELYEKACQFGNTAIFCVSRLSSEHTEHGDRSGGKGDFFLLNEEVALLNRLTEDFEKVIVVLNVCGPVSTSEYRDNEKIDAVLYALYGGGLGGEALTDILFGIRNPSGHLQTTLAASIEDYPSTAGYHESRDYVNYSEDIFVGYRYFETFCPEKVVYPFGYGLSYTTFSISKKDAYIEKNTVRISVQVENTGCVAGKEVVQAYLSAPQGELGKASKILCAFAKTKELAPGEKTVLTLRFKIKDFGSFDDLGKIAKSAFVLEKGEYIVCVGNNVRDSIPFFSFRLQGNLICKRCHSYMTPTALQERLCADGTMETLPAASRTKMNKKYDVEWKNVFPANPFALDAALAENRLNEFVAGLSDEELTEFLYGHPIMNISNTSGIGLFPKERRDVRCVPLVPTADGPAGLRTVEDCGILTTQFPCANTVSQTWNLSLTKRLAIAGAREVKENNVGIWLTPALNIHRNPMCGRNFEYYSEDPLTSGMFAAETVKGVQSQGIAATVKHFCCNNKERNRKESDSRVSERALREIYLRGFEIVVKTAKPWVLMTAYNRVNGVRSSTNKEAICGILRGEWGYDGVVVTDWWAFSLIEEEIAAGSDVKMPEMITHMAPNPPAPFDLADKLRDGSVDRDLCRDSVRRILELMGKLN